MKPNWEITEVNTKVQKKILEEYKLSEILASLIARRVSEDVEAYLQPKLKTAFPNPYDVPYMEKAVAQCLKAIQKNIKISVFGDYDVDGASSSALLIRFFKALGIQIDVYIPNRLTEGYGPNKNALSKLKEKGTEFLIIVDCGTASVDVLEHGKALGLEIIVLDHHLYEDKLSDAAIIVNPNAHKGLSDDFNHLCAAGVTYLFIVMVYKELRKISPSAPHVDLLQFLDIVALATVCDIMPLLGLNRAFVKQGLKVLNARNNLGICSLSSIAGIEDEIKAQHLGFQIGPRINAGGRIGQSELGYQILSTEHEKKSMDLAVRLNQLNEQRRCIQNKIIDDAVSQIEKQNLGQHPILLVGAEGWHSGVTGIVAGRLKELYEKPALVVAFDNGSVGQGSARSPEGISIGKLLHQGAEEGFLISGGGHAAAGGFKIEISQIESFYEYLIKILAEVEIPKPLINIDLEIPDFSGLSLDLCQEMDLLEPFGHKNPEPKFLVRSVRVDSFKVLKGKHVKCVLKDAGGREMQAISFDAFGKGFDVGLCQSKKPIDLVFTVQKNVWNGCVDLNLHVIDLNL